MTDQERQECTDPRLLLNYLQSKTSQRQRSLFAVACCRRFLPGPGSKPTIWPDLVTPFMALETEQVLLNLVERLADAPTDAEAETQFGRLSKELTEGWGVAAYGLQTEHILRVLRGEENTSWICDVIADYFISKFEAVCRAACESACKVAWTAWEAEESQSPVWQQMKAEWEKAANQSAWDGAFRLAAAGDEIEFAETTGKYHGLSASWEKHWHAEWTRIWEQAWNKQWPPFSWNVSRADLKFAEWERDALIQHWEDFKAELPGIFWKHGRRDVSNAMTALGFKVDMLKRALNDRLRAWTEKEMIAVIDEVFGNPFVR